MHLLVIDVGVSLYLFSVEQKKVTHGLRTLLSVEGGRYMASEKQVSNNLSNSALKVNKHRGRQEIKQFLNNPDDQKRSYADVCRCSVNSPIQIMDIVQRG